MNIGQTIRNVYYEFDSARKPKYRGIDPPPDQPYSESEVNVLIRDIVNQVNSEIAHYHFNKGADND